MSTREIIDTAIRIAQVVIWPLVVLLIAFWFRGTIRERIAQSEEVAVTGIAGIGFTAKGRIKAAADALVEASKQTGAIDQKEAIEQVGEAIKAVDAFGRAPRVLWVDDRPTNNIYERRAMEELGMVFELSTSTEEAFATIAMHGPYDVIISDMGRPPDSRAGYTLLDQLRRNGDLTPYVIYAGSRSQEHFDEAVRHGAVGTTNRPAELIDLVRKALRSAR